MLTLDKVQLLEQRIRKAVALINRLREENGTLKEQVQILKMHNEELKDFAQTYNQDNELIEQGIAKALAQLNEVEGLNEVTPVEDIYRSKEFAEFDVSSAQEQSPSQASDASQELEDVISYEDDGNDPLV